MRPLSRLEYERSGKSDREVILVAFLTRESYISGAKRVKMSLELMDDNHRYQ
jgi:hypothetical protein